MNCPNTLGLYMRCRPMLILAANEIRVQFPCDTEIDLVLADCFAPPLMSRPDPHGPSVPLAEGVAAYRAVAGQIEAAPRWLRCWLPVPKYDREWFRALVPNSKQLGWLWISPTLTLNAWLIESGHASKTQPLPTSRLYDGSCVESME